MDHQVLSQNTWTFSSEYVYMLSTELSSQFSENTICGIFHKSILKILQKWNAFTGLKSNVKFRFKTYGSFFYNIFWNVDGRVPKFVTFHEQSKDIL